VKPEDWIPADGMELEPNADRACREKLRNAAVMAGPGAGKTELLAQRADFLLHTNLCPFPKRILAISFKVDAAANLRRRVRTRVREDLAGRFDSYTFHAFSLGLIRRMRPALTGINALDHDFTIGDQRVARKQITFKDFVPLATEILRHPQVIRELRATYSHVFLDEFQDCTDSQYELVRTAFLDSPIRITAVGDTKQRIMGWAGALEGIFQIYANDFNAKGLNLYQNFRSAPVLRRMQNRMIARMDPYAVVPDDEIAGSSGTIRIFHSADDIEEAARITDWTRERIAEGTPESEIAILFAKQPELYGVTLAAALTDAGIPVRNEQKLQDLAAEPLTQIAVAFLRLVAAPSSPASFVHITRSRLFESDTETAAFRLRAAWEVHLAQCRTRIHGYADGIRSPGEIDRLVRDFLELFGPTAVAALHRDYEASARVEQLTTEIVEKISGLLMRPGNPAALLDRFGDEQAVKLMSIHKSKGLEFEAVAVVAVENEMFWGHKPDEDRATFFVGISRAKKELLLTVAGERANPGFWRWCVNRTQHHELLGYANE
jgi:superfamily I DNA/RNA helicase